MVNTAEAVNKTDLATVTSVASYNEALTEATPRAPARAQLPLLRFRPGGLAEIAPHEEPS